MWSSKFFALNGIILCIHGFNFVTILLLNIQRIQRFYKVNLNILPFLYVTDVLKHSHNVLP